MDREELVRRFANRNGAIFAGAGLSMGMESPRFPSWLELVEPLRVKLNIAPTEFIAPEQIAGWFEALEERHALVAHFRSRLPQGCKPSRCYELIASLPVDLYFTTNFDDLLESALREAAQVRPTTIVRDTDLADFSGEGKVLVKLHGDLDNADYMVATRHYYDRYLENRPGIVEMMRLTLMSRTVLFIGYSFNDHDLRLILSQVGTRMGKLRRPMYAIQLNPTAYVIAELKRYGVEVIPLQVPPGESATPILEAWLSGFCYDVEQRRNAILQLSADDTTSNLPDHCPRFIGRSRELVKICAHLVESRLVTLYGAPGVGKSTLAIEIARRCAFDKKRQLNRTDLLFAYTVYIDARDCHDESSLQEKVLNETASVLKVNAIRQMSRTETAEKTAQVAALLSIFRVLIIIDHVDNLDSNEASNFWAWASNIPQPSRLLIVTQRNQYRFATGVLVEGFNPADASAFLDFHVALRGKTLSADEAAMVLMLSRGTADGTLLLLGQLEHGRQLPVLRDDLPPPEPLRIEDLLEASWQLASDEARSVLIAASVFKGKTISRSALQAGAGMTHDEQGFDRALNECAALFLLSREVLSSPASHATIEYCLDPSTAAFGDRQATRMGEWGQQLHQRVAQYYADYARACLVRPTPPVPYWNVLASAGMRRVDDAWPKLRRILDWAGKYDLDLLVRLVFLLVHYLDTRLKNQDRLRYADAAIGHLSRQGRVYEEALLRIDALGWTLIEERRFDDAKREIRRGLRLLGATGDPERNDLIPLGYTWLARAYAEQDQMRAACAFIGRASQLAGGAQAWIACRVRMVEGDISFRMGDFGAALRHYQQGQSLALSYGGEEDYQWLPRVGMAHLHSGQLSDAEHAFVKLKCVSEEDHIAIGVLYAKYGLAQLSYRRDPSLRPHLAGMIEQIRVQLARFTSSHVLLTLLDGADLVEPRTGQACP